MIDLATISKLHALLDSIDTSECLYEEQCAARNFAAHGRDLLRMVEAANARIAELEAQVKVLTPKPSMLEQVKTLRASISKLSREELIEMVEALTPKPKVVDEMITYIRYRSMDEQEYKVCEAIIELLKAGLAMREMLSDGWNACRAWDAATKEDV